MGAKDYETGVQVGKRGGLVPTRETVGLELLGIDNVGVAAFGLWQE